MTLGNSPAGKNQHILLALRGVLAEPNLPRLLFFAIAADGILVLCYEPSGVVVSGRGSLEEVEAIERLERTGESTKITAYTVSGFRRQTQ